MSGGFYRLIRTDSQEEQDLEVYEPRPNSFSAVYTFLPRKWLPGRPSTQLGGILVSSRRLSRGSDSSGSSNSSTFSSRWKNQIFIACCLFIVMTVSLASVGLHWDKVQEYYYEQFIMATPGPMCLADRASSASYVHWNPNTNGDRAIYHCISRQLPQRLDEILAAPVGASLRAHRTLPSACLDSYYTNGSGCTDGRQTRYDIVWTWVNGSDPLIARAKAKAVAELQRQSGDWEEQEEEQEEQEEQEIEGKTSVHLFRDHDELRHSLRSVLQHFRESTKRFIILTSDFEFPGSYSPFKYLLGLEKRSQHKREYSQVKSASRKRNTVPDYEDDYEEDEEPFATARLGLLPQWLIFDTGKEDNGDHGSGDSTDGHKQRVGQWKDGDVSLEIIHHAEVFDQYDGTIFNSNSIESQLGNVVGDDTFIYFNDDCFFAAPLSSADFHTHNFGLVFRMIAYPWQLVNPHHYPGGSAIGEWHPMEYTNYLISERFGIRRRPYPMHQVKVLQGGLMKEMWEMWRVQEAINRGHKFRGLGGLLSVLGNDTWTEDLDPRDDETIDGDADEGSTDADVKAETRHRLIKRLLSTRDGDVPPEKTRHADPDSAEQIRDKASTSVDDGDAHVMFLLTHFIVERSREGMLWSWIVATLGGDNDEFGITQRNEAWRVLTEDAGAEELGRGLLAVLVEKRKTMEPWRVQWALDVVGDTLKASQYRFSSQDGYAYSYYDDERGIEWWHEGSTYWPLLFDEGNFDPTIESRPAWSRCTIDWNVCFDPSLQSASDVFKRIAFRHPQCGDCVLKALVRASGDLGLSALLPPSDRVYQPQAQGYSPNGEIPPHLPLDPEWHHADFSLAAVFASGFWTHEDGVNLRVWVQMMLERYRYVIADTDNYFNVVRDPVSAEEIFAYVDDHPKVALVTVNDNVEAYPEQTDRAMRAWFEQHWPTPAAWENPALTPLPDPDAESIPSRRSHRRKR